MAGTSKRALREDDTIDFDSRYQLKDYDEEEENEGVSVSTSLYTWSFYLLLDLFNLLA